MEHFDVKEVLKAHKLVVEATTRCTKGIAPVARLFKPIRSVLCAIILCMNNNLWSSSLLLSFLGVENGGIRVIHEPYIITNYEL